MKIVLFVRSLLTYLLIGITLAFVLPPLFIIACLPARYRYDNAFFFYLVDWLYFTSLYGTFNKVTFIGKEHLPKEGPVIFAANHQSALDIPVVGTLCNGYSHVWYVLAYYVNTPVLGFFVSRMFVPVERDKPVKAAGSLIRLLRFIQEQKRHLIIFPESRRFIDGKIHPFYGGFAMVAKRTKRPVIPVFMPNNGAIYPPDSFYIYRQPIDVIIGKPFYFQDDETEEHFIARVRDWFVEQNKNYSL